MTTWESIYLHATMTGAAVVFVTCVLVVGHYAYKAVRGEEPRNPGGRWWL